MKRRLALLLTVFALWSLGGVAFAAQSDKLVIWADELRSTVLKPIAQKFSKQYGVDVEIQELGFGDIRDNLGVAGPAGKGPDLLLGAHDWLGQLVANGLIEPIDLGTKKKDFAPVGLQAFTWGGKLYGVPYATESIGLVYNKKLVPKPPATFDELIAISKKLTDRSKKKYGFLMQSPDPYHTFPLLSATGGYVFGTKADGTLDPLDIGLGNTGSVRGANLFLQLIKDGLLPAGVDYQTMTSLFHQGQVGMMITGPWALADIRKAGIEYGFTKIPTIDGKQPKPFVGVQGFMVSSFSKNKILAKAFLTEFIATPETMKALFDRDPRPPAYLPTLKIASSDKDIAGIAASAEDGVPMPSIPEMSAVWTAWSDAISLIMNQKVTPQQAMADAVKSIRKTIEEGKKK